MREPKFESLAAPTVHTEGALSVLTDHPDAFSDQLPEVPAVAAMPLAPLIRLLSSDVLDSIFTSYPVLYPFVEVVRNGIPVDAVKFTVGPAGGPPVAPFVGLSQLVDTYRLAEQVEGGATLVLNMLDRVWIPIEQFCRQLAYELGMPVRANGFLTPPLQRGLAHHYDTDSVFLIQLEGSKTWQLYEPYLRAPLERQRYRREEVPESLAERFSTGTPDMEFTLHPGNVLWIPRGWIHNGYSQGQHSLHLTIGIAETSRYWVLDNIVDLIALDEEFRRDLPVRFANSPEKLARTLDGVLEELRAWIDRVDRMEIGRVVTLAHRRRLTGPRVRPLSTGLHSGREAPTTFTVDRTAICGLDAAATELAVHFGNRVLTFKGAAADVARRIVSGQDRQWNILDLHGLASDRVIQSVVGSLAASGVIVPVDGST